MATMFLDDLLKLYRPGSYDWSWGAECLDIEEKFPDEVDSLLQSIRVEGIKNPVLLGGDGRIWDGHKRIYCAAILELEEVPVQHATELASEAAQTLLAQSRGPKNKDGEGRSAELT